MGIDVKWCERDKEQLKKYAPAPEDQKVLLKGNAIGGFRDLKDVKPNDENVVHQLRLGIIDKDGEAKKAGLKKFKVYLPITGNEFPGVVDSSCCAKMKCEAAPEYKVTSALDENNHYFVCTVELTEAAQGQLPTTLLFRNLYTTSSSEESATVIVELGDQCYYLTAMKYLLKATQKIVLTSGLGGTMDSVTVKWKISNLVGEGKAKLTPYNEPNGGYKLFTGEKIQEEAYILVGNGYNFTIRVEHSPSEVEIYSRKAEIRDSEILSSSYNNGELSVVLKNTRHLYLNQGIGRLEASEDAIKLNDDGSFTVTVKTHITPEKLSQLMVSCLPIMYKGAKKNGIPVIKYINEKGEIQ